MENASTYHRLDFEHREITIPIYVDAESESTPTLAPTGPNGEINPLIAEIGLGRVPGYRLGRLLFPRKTCTLYVINTPPTPKDHDLEKA